MLIKKHFQNILLLISIVAISATNLNPPRPVQNDIISDPVIVDDEIPFIDLNDRAVVEEEMRKINLYKSIEGETVRHLDPKELEEQNKLRGLAEFNEFDNVKIVDPNTNYYAKIRKLLIKSIK